MPRRATVKSVKVPLGADGEDIAGMFNSMLGEGRLDLAVAYPKYCALKEYLTNIHSIFTELIGSPFFASYPEFSTERTEIETFLSNLKCDIEQAFEFNFDREIFELDKLPEDQREAFTTTYRAIKTSNFVNEMIKMGDNLADYRDRIDAEGRGPATRHIRASFGQPATQMFTTLAGEVSMRADLPLTVTLTYDVDEPRRLFDSSFMFFLLDEDGRQVARHLFIGDALAREVPLPGFQPTYKPRLVWDHHVRGLVVGKRYQLITVAREYGLVSSVWFTLAG